MLGPLGVEDPSIGTFSQTFASKGTMLLDGIGGGAQDIIAGRRPLSDWTGSFRNGATTAGRRLRTNWPSPTPR